MKSFFEVFTKLSSIFSFGTILITLINYFLNKRSNPSEFEQNKLKFYEDMYFNGIKNGLGEPLDIDTSKQYFNSLINKLLDNPKKSIYLSDQTKAVLRFWKENRCKTGTLLDRVEREYNKLQYRFQYKNRLFNSQAKYLVLLCIFFLSLCICSSSVFFIITDFVYIKQLYTNDKFTILLIIDSFYICFISALFLWEDRYIFFNPHNKNAKKKKKNK